MSRGDVDRDLLFGVAALRLGLIDRDQFAEACAAWASAPDRPLADVLAARGWLTAEGRARVEGEVEREALGRQAGAQTTLPESGQRTLSLAPTEPGEVGPGAPNGPPAPADGPRYRLTRVHAEGGLGRVWLARDHGLNREVAVKEVRPDHADDPGVCRRFLKEAQITGQLEHPGVVPVYELAYRKEDGQPFYVMRLVRGRTFREVIAEHHRRRGKRPADRLELNALLGTFLKVCETVGYAHSRGVVHRDLKPENVVLGGFGEVVVLDWGLAALVDRPGPGEADAPCGPAPEVALSGEAEAVRTLGQVGTPAYMAPEQVECRHDLIGARTDVYALGGILYEILTGRPPADGRTTAEVFRKILDGQIAPVRSLAPGASRVLAAVCHKALARDPAARYAGATELADDVRRWLAGEDVSAYRDWLPVRLWRRLRPYRRWLPLVLCAAFFDLLTAAVALFSYVDAILDMTPDPVVMQVLTALVLAPVAAQVGAVAAAAGVAASRRLAPRPRSDRPDPTGRGGLTVAALAGAGVAVAALLIGLFASRAVDDLLALPLALEPEAPRRTEAPTDFPRLPGANDRPALELLAPGAPFDAAAFLAAPPEEENAAPLYLDALMEFDPEMADCFPDGEGRRRAAIARRRRARADAVEKVWSADRASADRGEVDALLDEYAVGFLKLAQAQRRPRCEFRSGLGVTTHLPHLQPARTAARLTALRAARALERGDADAALADAAVVLRLSADVRPRAPFVGQLVGLSIQSLACRDVVTPLLNAPGLTPGHCDRLLAALRGRPGRPPDPLAEGARAEYLMVGQTVHDLIGSAAREQQLRGSAVRRTLQVLRFKIRPSASLSDAELAEELASVGPEFEARVARDGPDRFRDETLRLWRAQTRALLDLESVPLRERPSRLTALSGARPADNPLIRTLTVDIAPVATAHLRGEARLRATLALVALRRWQLTGGDPSADLATVARAAGLPGAPADPYRPDGGPLRLAVIDGERFIYSVGPDGRDDGGRGGPPDDQRDTPGDLRFSLQAN